MQGKGVPRKGTADLEAGLLEKGLEAPEEGSWEKRWRTPWDGGHWRVGFPGKVEGCCGGVSGARGPVFTGLSPLHGSKALEGELDTQRRVPHLRPRSGSRPRPSPPSRSRLGPSRGCRRPARRS